MKNTISLQFSFLNEILLNTQFSNFQEKKLSIAKPSAVHSHSSLSSYGAATGERLRKGMKGN